MWRGGRGSAGSAAGERLGRRAVSKWVKSKVITPVSDCSDEHGEIKESVWRTCGGEKREGERVHAHRLKRLRGRSM